MVPPALHHLMLRQLVHAVIVTAQEDAEQVAGLPVEVDRIIGDAGLLQKRHQLGPDGVVPAAVLLLLPRIELHPERVFFHWRNPPWRRPAEDGWPAAAV